MSQDNQLRSVFLIKAKLSSVMQKFKYYLGNNLFWEVDEKHYIKKPSCECINPIFGIEIY